MTSFTLFHSITSLTSAAPTSKYSNNFLLPVSGPRPYHEGIPRAFSELTQLPLCHNSRPTRPLGCLLQRLFHQLPIHSVVNIQVLAYVGLHAGNVTRGSRVALVKYEQTGLLAGHLVDYRELTGSPLARAARQMVVRWISSALGPQCVALCDGNVNQGRWPIRDPR
jgi:hypothetical protein